MALLRRGVLQEEATAGGGGKGREEEAGKAEEGVDIP